MRQETPDPETGPAPGRDEALGDVAAFVHREQHTLARGPAHERPVNASVGEEADERADRLFVRPDRAVAQRRHRGRDRPREHGQMLVDRWFPPGVKADPRSAASAAPDPEPPIRA